MWPEYVGPASGVRVTIAVGVTQPSPARKGWEPKSEKSRFPFGGIFADPPACDVLTTHNSVGIRKW